VPSFPRQGLDSTEDTNASCIDTHLQPPNLLITMAPLTFTEWETLAPAGPIRPSISLLARQQLPFLLPWSTVPIPIGTTFFSSRASGPAPFANTSPFDAASLSSTRLNFEARKGGQATFTNTSSRHTGHNEEHLSASLGVSVGCKFLSVGVTGSYDEDVVQNNDVSHTWHIHIHTHQVTTIYRTKRNH
jgi:hypothetical protein